MSRFQPRKATRHQLKARVAIDGPTGSGKTFTALEWAMKLQGEGRTVVIDTERGSASWYCDRWDYDVVDWAPPYAPNDLAAALADAARDYEVVIIDSFSHFWEGEGGTLDIADAAGQRAQGNSFAGWKTATPQLRHLIDTILGLDCHVITTMRSKMEYVLDEDSRGKKVPRKVGLAPVMRQGVEYEFTLICDMDLEHRLVVSKSRCSALADQVYPVGRTSEAADVFLAWLDAGEALAPRVDIDALRERIGSITDKDARNEAKALFKAEFGDPNLLLADALPDAVAFVERVVAAATEDADVNPDAVVVAASASSVGDDTATPVSSGGAEATSSAPPSPPTQAQMRALHAALAKAGVPDDERHDYATLRLGRDVDSFTTLTRAEVAKLTDAAKVERHRRRLPVVTEVVT